MILLKKGRLFKQLYFQLFCRKLRFDFTLENFSIDILYVERHQIPR
jgi:hypothetical protein